VYVLRGWVIFAAGWVRGQSVGGDHPLTIQRPTCRACALLSACEPTIQPANTHSSSTSIISVVARRSYICCIAYHNSHDWLSPPALINNNAMIIRYICSNPSLITIAPAAGCRLYINMARSPPLYDDLQCAFINQ